jgi:hypothetical protein
MATIPFDETTIPADENSQKILNLTIQLEAAKAINDINSEEIEKIQNTQREISMEFEREKARHECIHKEYTVKFKAAQEQIEMNDGIIANLHNIILAKDALLAKADGAQQSIHQKLDLLLARRE